MNDTDVDTFEDIVLDALDKLPADAVWSEDQNEQAEAILQKFLII
jgi:hypothetical protein